MLGAGSARCGSRRAGARGAAGIAALPGASAQRVSAPSGSDSSRSTTRAMSASPEPVGP